MLNEIIKNTDNYISRHSKNERKEKGQFFTPLEIVNFMAEKAAKKTAHLSILEPGAGNGLLSAAVVKYCIEKGLCSSFNLHFIENDLTIRKVLNQTVSILKTFAKENNAKITVSVSSCNYITEEENHLYDVVICNPPYKKIRKDSEESKAMKEYVFGQPNLYSLFMAKAINNLKQDGNFVFITPRSWASGDYYKITRKFVLNNLCLTDLLLFEDRDKVFGEEDVLQETLITVGRKGTSQIKNINVYSSLEKDKIKKPMLVKASTIKRIGPDDYLLLPSSKADLVVINQMAAIPDTFESLGYCFKTGPVVEFRNKDALSSKMKNGYVPMYRTANIINGKCIFPADTSKAQFVNSSEKKLLVTNMNTVLLRRMSAKEECRRLQSCVYYKTEEEDYISIENHVNYLVHTDGSPLSVEEVEWINELLMSPQYDTYYRIINGSTQVNASEVNKLPLQRRA